MNNSETIQGNGIHSGRTDGIMNQFEDLRREINYNMRDFTIDFLVSQFRTVEYFIDAEYQRNFVWDEERKCRFIESILLGYLIPIMFFSDNDDGRSDILMVHNASQHWTSS